MKFNVLVSSVLGLGAVVAQADSVPNRLLVKFKNVPGALTAQRFEAMALSAASAELGKLSHFRSLGHSAGMLRYASALQASVAANLLRSDPNVEWVQPDYIMRTMRETAPKNSLDGIFHTLFDPGTTVPSPALPDPAFAVAPALPQPSVTDLMLGQAWGLQSIKVAEAWDLQKGNREIIVADIDTGIDYTHEDLVNNLWTNPDVNAPDVHGYDFVNNDNFPFDDQGHGTHTAGTIGATGGNGVGISGVAQAVSIMGLKFLSKDGSGTTSDAIRAIDYAILNKARIMSNSWGGGGEDSAENQALTDAVSRANDADILFVAAAGNEGSDNDAKPTYPAAIRLPNMLTVASTKQGDARSFFSNYGRETVHVAAPGSNILSSLPGNKYGQESGTSMACPHVAGLAALILSERPELTALQVKQIIMESVDAASAFEGKTVTGGRINARSAIEKARVFGI